MPIGTKNVTFLHGHPKLYFPYFFRLNDIIIYLVKYTPHFKNCCIYVLIPQIFNDKYFVQNSVLDNEGT